MKTKTKKDNSIYPVIATFKFKSKVINLEVPIRAKLITFKQYECISDFKHKFSLTQAGNFMQRFIALNDKNFAKCFNKPKKYHAPRDKIQLKLCPYCYTYDMKAKLKLIDKTLIKLWVPYNKKCEYVDLNQILQLYTLLRWKKVYTAFSSGGCFNGSICYCDNLAQAYSWLKIIKPEKGCKYKMSLVFPDKTVDDEMLLKAREFYEQKKVEKAI